MRRLAGKALAVLIPVAVLAVASWAVVRTSGGGSITNPHPAATGAPAATGKLLPRYYGVAVPSPLERNLRAFTAAAGTVPGIVEYYERFGSAFRDSPADVIERRGALPMMQWNPAYVPLAKITDGSYDAYLRAYAASVRAFRARIIISFGHEMNGPWWTWSAGRQSPAGFVAAWRHIHHVFTAAGASNVIWCWNPNVVSGPQVATLAPWWPGTAYVDWIGLDGYYFRPGYSFASIFGATLREARRLGPGKPVMIAETGAYPGPQMPARITNLFSGAASAGLVAVVYFDHKGQQDWRIEHTPAAAAAFRSAAAKYVRAKP